MGTLVPALGVVLSVKLDTPTGATIVCTFGGVLVLMFLVQLLVFHRRGDAEKPFQRTGDREITQAERSGSPCLLQRGIEPQRPG